MGLGGGFLLFLNIPAAHADDATTTTVISVADGCTITKADLEVIKSIENNSALSYQEELSQELAARKELLNEILNCAETQVATLKSQLTAPQVAGAQATAIQTSLVGKLNDATTYYELERSQLAGAGIFGTEQVAQQVLAWRAGSFAPINDEITSFLLWLSNQPLFTAAATRMTQVGQVVSFLASTNNSALAGAFATAQSSFNAAQNQNATALNAISQSAPAAQVSGSIQQSLQSLSTAYKNLFTVSTIIQGLVPQGSQ